jgi:hypothetical protein
MADRSVESARDVLDSPYLQPLEWCSSSPLLDSAITTGSATEATASPLSLDPIDDLFPVDRHILGRVDSDANLLPLHAENDHGDIVADPHGFGDPYFN